MGIKSQFKKDERENGWILKDINEKMAAFWKVWIKKLQYFKNYEWHNVRILKVWMSKRSNLVKY